MVTWDVVVLPGSPCVLELVCWKDSARSACSGCSGGSVGSGGSGSYREDPAGPAARPAEPVPRDDMPTVSGAAGGRGLATGRGAR